MFWVYLSIFIMAVLSPQLITSGFFFLDEEQSEQLAIFFLGIVGLVIFMFKERQFDRYLREVSRVQRKINHISRDLTDSYSYIGEMNRKLDILEGIVSVLPENLPISPEKEKEIFTAILNAAKVISATDRFSIALVDLKTGKTEKILPASSDFAAPKISDQILKDSSSVIEKDDCHIVRSLRDMNEKRAYLIVGKKLKGQLKDLNIIHVLLSQSLFYFTYINEHGPTNKRK